MNSVNEEPPLEASREMSEQLTQLIERDRVRAAVVGLYDNGRSRVIGFGRLSRTDADTPDGSTVFEIGSVGKVFTSLLIQTQIDAGRLDWGRTVASCLPDVEFASADVAGITLLELSTHTSGLPREPDNLPLKDPTNPYAGYERSDLLSFLSSYEPASLSKEYGYSNLGAGLLGEIAADAAGKGYADAMQRDVLHPLGLEDTHVGLRPDFTPRLAGGFSDGWDVSNWDGFDALAGAGALVSTADDLLRFLDRSLNRSGSDDAIAAIQIRQGDGETALGWHHESLGDDASMLWHNGGTGGYASFLAMDPDSGRGIVILTSSTEYTLVTELGFAHMSGRSGVAPLADAGVYVGAYQLTEGFVLTIFVEDGRLHAQATGQGAFPLSHESGDAFLFEPADVEIQFERDDKGAVEKLIFVQAGNETLAPRVSDELGPKRYESIQIGEAILKDYEGQYQLASDTVINVETREGRLFAQLTGQPAFPVYAYEFDRFFYKVVDAQLHFERDESGIVDAVSLHQGGEQRAPKIVE